MALHIHTFSFNPFQENTYLLYTDTREAILFDPGNSTRAEDAELDAFILKNGLNIQDVCLTHAHIDHVLGIAHVFEKYQKQPRLHAGELELYYKAVEIGDKYGIPCRPLPEPKIDVKAGDSIQLGKYTLEIAFTPGHSPASVCFICKSENVAIVGDVLFKQSIGRTDLPGGDYDTLIQSVETQLFTLDTLMQVFPGHGPSTTIGDEIVNNPFFK